MSTKLHICRNCGKYHDSELPGFDAFCSRACREEFERTEQEQSREDEEYFDWINNHRS